MAITELRITGNTDRHSAGAWLAAPTAGETPALPSVGASLLNASVNRTFPRRLLWSFAALLPLLFSFAAHALEIITADGALDRYGVDKREGSLLDYLENGIPADFRGKPFERWETYSWIATKLGELESTKALPLLIRRIQEPLPLQLQKDLELHVAGSLAHHSWEDWDRGFLREVARFREACAMSLARIGDHRALPILTAYLESLTQIADHELEWDNPDSSLLWSFSGTCSAIAGLGSKEGIDALIAALDDLPTRSPEHIIYYLRLCTGQPFGPEYSQPLHRWPAEIRKWKEWWERNRDSYRVDLDRVLRRGAPELPRPRPRSLRDHVAAAETRYFDYDGTAYGKRSVRWLEFRGRWYVRGLAAIVNDADEDARVRGEALKWYARFGGRRAFDVLAGYATDDSRYSELGIDRLHLQITALNLVEEFFPESVDRVAKNCMLSSHQVSGNAIHILMKKPENYRYVADSFAKLAYTARFQAIQKLLYLDEPLGRQAFFEAVKEKDVHMAQYGARGIRKFSLESELPEDSRQALDRWRNDPEFLLLMIDETEPQPRRVSKILQALQLIKEPDAETATVYYRAWNMLPAQDRDIAMKGLERCIDAYRQRRADSG